jgi:uncharacterized phiE125 gp8 family phage protein
MPVRVTLEPQSEPVTLDEAKSQCRLQSGEDDALVESLIIAARRQVEKWEWRSHVTQTVTLKLDRFPCGPIYLPRPPLQSVTSIVYVDSNGDAQTLAPSAYTVDSHSEPGRIVPAYGEVWPVTQAVPNAVTVVYIAGYGGAAQVPAETRAAIRLLVGHLHENREAVVESARGDGLQEIPLGVDALLNRCHDARVLEAV